jgi:hypothetical protein
MFLSLAASEQIAQSWNMNRLTVAGFWNAQPRFCRQCTSADLPPGRHMA